MASDELINYYPILTINHGVHLTFKKKPPRFLAQQFLHYCISGNISIHYKYQSIKNRNLLYLILYGSSKNQEQGIKLLQDKECAKTSQIQPKQSKLIKFFISQRKSLQVLFSDILCQFLHRHFSPFYNLEKNKRNRPISALQSVI